MSEQLDIFALDPNDDRVSYPSLTRLPWGRCPGSVLLVAHYDPSGPPAVREQVACIQAASSHGVTVLNTFEHRPPQSPRFPLSGYHVVLVHNTQSYDVDNIRALEQLFDVSLAAFDGLKLAMKQDENHRFRETDACLATFGFHDIFTCLPPEAVPLIYPACNARGVRFHRMLTGYVNPPWRRRACEDKRPIEIGYRGSMQPLSFGRLAYDKRRIGELVSGLAGRFGLVCDISSQWQHRLSGEAWIKFLRSCRATLGCESGASVFDLDGTLERRCREAEAVLGPFKEDAGYAEAYLAHLSDLEDRIHYNQISPRHFEAAAARTLQVMLPGNYSGIFIPGKHFIELDRSGSNLAEVLDMVRDDARREEMVERAFEEIVMDRQNWIEHFVARLDDVIRHGLRDVGKVPREMASLNSAGGHVLVLAAHELGIDPRLGWIRTGAPKELGVSVLGVGESDRVIFSGDGESPGFQVTHRRSADDLKKLWRWQGCRMRNAAGDAAFAELNRMHASLSSSESGRAFLHHASTQDQRHSQFRWYLEHFLQSTASLVEGFMRFRGVDLVVAADLNALPAALLIKGITGLPVLYDAHEFWPESDPSQAEFERQFWIDLERRLVSHADQRQTVSDGLAALMTRLYGVPFSVVPNCEPLRRIPSAIARSPRVSSDSRCRFVFQGGFAPHRGIEELIAGWTGTPDSAELLLRGPSSAYRAQMIRLAKTTGLLGSRIQFPEAVAPDQLIDALRDVDVGIIPYLPVGQNYAHCCPNKMSEYMAAGLPIIANETNFVAQVVRRSGAGVVIDIRRPESLVNAVRMLLERPAERERLGRRAQMFFEQEWNWEKASVGMYGAMSTLIAFGGPSRPLRLYEPQSSTPGLLATGLLHQDSMQIRRQVTNMPMARKIWIRTPEAVRRVLRPALRAWFN